MPPKKKAKSIITDAIEDLERDYEEDDENDLNSCKVSLGRWRNIKHWKKINQSFADNYEIDPETLQQRSMSYVQLIPVENLKNISPEWKDCFLAETEKYFTLNFNDWRIRPDDQITEVFEDYQQKKSRDDSIYRYMFRRLDSSYISKAIIAYTKLSSRPSRCLFYLLKYMISISPVTSNIYDVINFIFNRPDISPTERIEYKKAYIFEIFPSFLERLIACKQDKQWRTPFSYVLRILVELTYGKHDPDARALKMTIHLFKTICEYRQYPKITGEYHNLPEFFTDLMDFQKACQPSPTIPDDVSVKSEDTDSESPAQNPGKDSDNLDRDNESIVSHSIFLYTLAWIQYVDPNSVLCFMAEYFNVDNFIGKPVKGENGESKKSVDKPKFVVWDAVEKKFSSVKLMVDIKSFLDSHFPDVFKSFFQDTKMESMYFCKQIQLNFELLDGNCTAIQESLKSLFSETQQLPAFTLTDIYVSQIGNFIRLDKYQEAQNILTSFSHQLLKLFRPEESTHDPKKSRIFPKGMGKAAVGDEREIQVRCLNLDNTVDVLVNYMIIILIKQVKQVEKSDKKLADITKEKLLILSQHNWPQYSPLVDYCINSFETTGRAVLPSFRAHIGQASLIEELAGLKHRSPNVRFVLTEDCSELTNELAGQILLQQIEKSMKQLSTLFYLDFILSSLAKS